MSKSFMINISNTAIKSSNISMYIYIYVYIYIYIWHIYTYIYIYICNYKNNDVLSQLLLLRVCGNWSSSADYISRSQVHELPQSHCSVNREGTLFLLLQIYWSKYVKFKAVKIYAVSLFLWVHNYILYISHI